MTDWVVSLMDALGAPGVGLAVALENLIPFIPSELILPLAGFAAARGSFSLVEALIWSTVGSTVGALALYGIGRALGRDRMRAVARRMPLVKLRDLDRTEDWFARHGRKAIFFGRMVPVFRSLVSVPAGLARTPLGWFVALTAGGSLIWNTVFVVAGHQLGSNWHLVTGYADVLSWVVVGAVVVAIAVWIVRRLRVRAVDRARAD